MNAGSEGTPKTKTTTPPPTPSGAVVEARLREASRLAGSLRPEHRLATKIDLRGAAVAARLEEASDLLDLCRALARAGRTEGAAPARAVAVPADADADAVAVAAVDQVAAGRSRT